MRNLVLVALLAAIGWYAYQHYQRTAQATTDDEVSATEPAESAESFRCDGRVYCSQMTSCAEATYFLRNCPGVKIDGNHDGVPCDKQWCN